jgi:hypothetical protein
MTLLFAPRRSGTAGRARRRCNLEVCSLEGRALLSGPGDVTPPVTTAVLLGTPGQNGFFRSPVTVVLTASDVDDAANTLKTFFSVNGAPYAQGNTVKLTHDGAYVLSFFSTDPAGNFEAVHTELIKIDHTPPVITAFASPNTLWPPNHKFVAVTVTGHVSDNFSGVASRVYYHVVDEYGQVEPSGSAAVNSSGNYSFVVDLEASRLGQDKDGRQYYIDVTAHDLAGNSATAVTIVTVPHDQGNHNGQGSQGNGNGNSGGTDTGTGNGGSGNGDHGNGHGNHGNGHGKQK